MAGQERVMLQKAIRVIFGETRREDVVVRSHESGQMALLSTRELELRKMYERMAQRQRLIEVEEDMRRKL